MDQQIRDGADISIKVKALSKGFEDCVTHIATVTATQASDMQQLKDLGAQVAALWSNPSPHGSPRDPEATEVNASNCSLCELTSLNMGNTKTCCA
jgi:hypothetical protein